MAIGHIAVRPHSRAQGHCVAAAVAYRCGLALTCERTGERYDFTRRAQREDVVGYGLEGGRFNSAGDFAAAVEGAERRKNARICRDVQVALPAELDEPSRIELARAFAAELAERYGTAACWAVHRPDRRSDQRNHHAHILLPTRALAADGCTFGKKLRVLDDQRRGPKEITAIRQLWEARANEALIAAGQEATVHTGRTTDPEPTLGTTHTAIERKAWKRRHAGQRQRPMSAAQLVVADGKCVTKRGRVLARHVLARHVALRAAKRYFVGEDTQFRSSPALAPVAARGFASAVVAVVPEPEPRPVRPPAPVVARGLAGAVVAVVPEPEPRPVRPPAPVVARGFASAVVAVEPEPEPRPVRPPAPVVARGFASAVVAVVPEPEPRPVRPPAPVVARGFASAVVAVVPEPEPRPVRPPAPVVARGLAGAVVAVVPEPEPRPVRPPAPVVARGLAGAVVAVVPEPEPRPARVSGLHAITKKLKELWEQLKGARIRQALAPTQEDLQAARDHLSRRQPSRRGGYTLRNAADSIARQRLTADVIPPESHPQGNAGRPALRKAISALAPRAAPGYLGGRSDPIPDSWNTGACRTQAGAAQAAAVLDRAIDDIARKHFKGHTDPRDYRPGWIKRSIGRSIERAKKAAFKAWTADRERVIECMISAAEGPEAAEIRRRRIEHVTPEIQERRRHAQRAKARGAQETQSRESPKSPKSDQGSGIGY